MTPVLPIDGLGFCEANESFIDQCSWLKGVSGGLPSKAAFGNLMEIRQQKLEESGFDLGVTSPPSQ
jgi:hypothetical protein